MNIENIKSRYPHADSYKQYGRKNLFEIVYSGTVTLYLSYNMIVIVSYNPVRPYVIPQTGLSHTVKRHIRYLIESNRPHAYTQIVSDNYWSNILDGAHSSIQEYLVSNGYA